MERRRRSSTGSEAGTEDIIDPEFYLEYDYSDEHHNLDEELQAEAQAATASPVSSDVGAEKVAGGEGRGEEEGEGDEEEEEEEVEASSFLKQSDGVCASRGAVGGYLRKLERVAAICRPEVVGGAPGKWRKHSASRGVELWVKKVRLNDKPLQVAKGVGYVDAAAQVVLEVFSDVAYRKHWDDRFLSGEVVEDIDPMTSVVYMRFKTPRGTKARDTVSVSQNVRDSDGSFWRFSTSVEHPRCPVNAKHVRGQLLLSCTHCKPVTRDRCQVTYLVGYRAMGKIPRFLGDRVIAKQPLCIAVVSDLIARDNELVERACQSAVMRQKRLAEAAEEEQEELNLPSQMSGVGDDDDVEIDEPAHEEEQPLASPDLLSADSPVPTPASPAPGRYEEALARAFRQAARSVEEGREQGWNFQLRTRHVSILLKPGPDAEDTALDQAKGQGYIAAPAERIRDVFLDMGLRSRWDPLFTEGRIVEQIDANTRVDYIALQLPSPDGSTGAPHALRDIVSVVRSHTFENSSIIVFAASVEHPREPPRRGWIRTRLLYSSLYIRPVEDKCFVTYVTWYDLGPDEVVGADLMTLFTSKVPLSIAAVAELIENTPEKEIDEALGASAALAQVRAEAEAEVSSAPKPERGNPEPKEGKPELKEGKPEPEEEKPEPALDPAKDPDAPAESILLSEYRPPPSQYDAVLERARELAEAAVAGEESDGWVFNSRQEDVDIFIKSEPGSSVNCTRGVGEVDVPARLFRAIMTNMETKPQWDEMFDHGSELARVDPVTGISYTALKAPWPVTPRDMVVVGRTFYTDDGGSFTYMCSTEHPDKPETRSFVRSTLIYGAIRCFPLRGGTRCRVVYSVGADPNGSLPKWLVNAVNIKQPLIISKLRKFIRENPAAVAQAQSELAATEATLLQAIREQRREALESEDESESEAEEDERKQQDGPQGPDPDAPAECIMLSELVLEPTEYDAALDNALRLAEAAVTGEESDGWVFNSRQEDVDIFIKSEPGSSVNCTRGVGEVDVPARLFRAIMANMEYKSQWDEMFDHGANLLEVDVVTEVSYTALKAPWPVAARDMVVVARTLYTDDGGSFTYMCSTEHPDKPAGQGKFVRSTLIYGAIRCFPVSETRCRVVYSIGADPNGSLPKWLVNSVNVKQPLVISKLRKFIRENPAAVAQAKRSLAAKEARVLEQIREQRRAGLVAGGEEVEGGSDEEEQQEQEEEASLPPSKYDPLLEKAAERALSAIHGGEDDGWKFHSEQKGVQIFIKEPPGSPVNFCKGVGEVDAPAAVVFDVFTNQAIRTRWDTMFSHGREVEEVDRATNIVLHSLKAPWPVTPRDTAIIGRWTTLPDGAIFSYSTSVEHPGAPPIKGYVRAHLVYGALYVLPLSETRCRVVYSIGADPKGSLPKWVVNASNVNQPLCIANVATLLKTDRALYREVLERVVADKDEGKKVKKVKKGRKSKKKQEVQEASEGVEFLPQHQLQTAELNKFRGKSMLRHVFSSQVGVLVVSINGVRGVGELVVPLREAGVDSLSLFCRVKVSKHVVCTSKADVTKSSSAHMDALSWSAPLSVPLVDSTDVAEVDVIAHVDGQEDVVLASMYLPLLPLADDRPRRGWYKYHPMRDSPGQEDLFLLGVDSRCYVSETADAFSPAKEVGVAAGGARGSLVHGAGGDNVVAQPYDAKILVTAGTRLLRNIKPLEEHVRWMRRLVSWESPYETGMLLLAWVAVLMVPWLLPLAVGLFVVWKLVIGYAEMRFEQVLHGTVEWHKQRLREESLSRSLARSLRTEERRILHYEETQERMSERQLHEYNKTILRARRRTLQWLQDVLVYLAELSEMVRQVFAWTDPELTVMVLGVCVVAICVAAVSPAPTVPLAVGVAVLTWRSRLVRRLRRVPEGFLAYMRRRRRRQAFKASGVAGAAMDLHQALAGEHMRAVHAEKKKTA